MEKETNIDRFYNAIGDIQRNIRALEDIAVGMQMLGMHEPANKIFDTINIILEKITVVRISHGEQVSEYHNNAIKSSGTMIAAMFAGIELGKKERS